MFTCQMWASAATSSQASVAKRRTIMSRLSHWSERSATMWGFFLPTVWERWPLSTPAMKTQHTVFSLTISWACSVDDLQKTHAFHRLQDDVPAHVKQRRLEECSNVFREEASKVNAALIGSTQLVLVEGVSKLLYLDNFNGVIPHVPQALLIFLTQSINMCMHSREK